MTSVFPELLVTTAPTRGSEWFPVRRIYCVGRNYAAHAREMGHSDREEPFFFMKPNDALTPNNVELDFPTETAELQSAAKQKSRPWDLSKGFDESAPMTEIVPAAECGHISEGAIWLDIDGQRKQSGDISDLIWNVSETIAYLSRFVALKQGDLIFTGTPAGVGPVRKGETMVGHVDGLDDLRVSYKA